MAELQKTGVEAVVEGLSSFKSDVDDMIGKIGEIGSKGNLLTRALGGAWDMLQNFGQSVVHVAEYALGQLLADAVEFVISKIKELISATIEAGSQFQLLELRLNRLNFNTALNSGLEFNEALEEGTALTKDQLTWLQKLAVVTPYDAQDIANVFTLARSYGFASDASKMLTQDIVDFASGMGLGNTEIERIIVNFGQLAQQGKLNARELTDLARGAFVPINDLLARMEENTGKTGKAFDSFKKTGESVNEFFRAFSEIVHERFGGAAETMSRTFKGATDNAQDFFKSLIGFGVVRPVLSAVGESVAKFVSALTEPKRWEAMTQAAGRVGEGFSQILRLLEHAAGIDPSGLADKLVAGLNRIADWIAEHRSEIYQFFVRTRERILEIWAALKAGDFGGFLKAIGLDDATIAKILKFKDGIVSAFDTIRNWVEENGPLIQGFFNALGQIIAGVFKNLGVNVGAGLGGFLDVVKGVMEFIINNQEGIITFITWMIKLQVVLGLIGIAFSLIAGPVLAFFGLLLSIAAAIGIVLAVLAFLSSGIGILAVLIVALIVVWAKWGQDAGVFIDFVKFKFGEMQAAITAWLTDIGTKFGLWVASVIAWFDQLGDSIHNWLTDLGTAFGLWFASLVEGVGTFVSSAVSEFGGLWAQFTTMINNIIAKVQNVDWAALGKGIILGMIRGITSAVGGLISAVSNAVGAAIKAAQTALKAKSPSRVFMEIGKGTMEGMAIGIERMAGVARASMVDAMAGIALPALALQSASARAGNSVSNVNNYSYQLTVNSQSQAEPLLQDFNMMKSIIGA